MDSLTENIFVFVACGIKTHTETLNFSLPFLQRRTSNRIIVVTDLSRNEGAIQHTDVIDVKTPENFNHHQAAIYLKTSLHRILPKGNLYCYIDSDILAIGENVGSIFSEYISPISFVADRASLNFYSPYAVNCECVKKHSQRPMRRMERIAWFYKGLVDIELTVEASKNNPFYFLRKWQYSLSSKYYRLNRKYRLEKESGVWYLNDGQAMIFEEFKFKEMEDFVLECSHLHEMLQKEFGLQDLPTDWQHWNGGVFLFDNNSHTFMEEWHNTVLSLFSKEGWKTRDQPALIATVWKFALQEHPTLDTKWNFMVDYKGGKLTITEEGDMLVSDGKIVPLPEFAHVYLRFGDENWPVWNFLTAKK